VSRHGCPRRECGCRLARLGLVQNAESDAGALQKNQSNRSAKAIKVKLNEHRRLGEFGMNLAKLRPDPGVFLGGVFRRGGTTPPAPKDPHGTVSRTSSESLTGQDKNNHHTTSSRSSADTPTGPQPDLPIGFPFLKRFTIVLNQASTRANCWSAVHAAALIQVLNPEGKR